MYFEKISFCWAKQIKDQNEITPGYVPGIRSFYFIFVKHQQPTEWENISKR